MEQAVRVAGTLYWIRNPRLLADFTDHGKLLFTSGPWQAASLSTNWRRLHRSAKQLRQVRKASAERRGTGATSGKSRWPWDSGETYDIFYPDASGATLLTQQRPCVMAREAGSRLSKVFAAIRRLILSVTTHSLILPDRIYSARSQ